MRYLHSMVRVADLEQSLDFYCTKLGLEVARRFDNEQGRYTLVFLAAPGDTDRALVELTYNWDPEPYTIGRAFGHLAYEVDAGASVTAAVSRRASALWSAGLNLAPLICHKREPASQDDAPVASSSTPSSSAH